MENILSINVTNVVVFAFVLFFAALIVRKDLLRVRKASRQSQANHRLAMAKMNWQMAVLERDIPWTRYL